jgi:hypothetical protein
MTNMNDSLWAAFARAIDALSPVFLAALSWLAIRIAALINTRVKGEKVRAVLHRLDDAVFTAVREVEQVLVVSLKTASADGSLTEAERAEVKDAATKAVRGYVGAKGWLEFGAVLGLSNDELERVLAARVEAAVYDLRGHPARVLSNVLRTAFSTGTAPPPHAANGSQ